MAIRDLTIPLNDVLRADAVLRTYETSLGDERAEDRYVVQTVREILDRASRAIEEASTGARPCREEVRP